MTLVLQKGHCNAKNFSYYRPISILCVLSKLLERIVAAILSEHLSTNNLPYLQSAFRAFHSTETAMLKVSSDVITALDRGDLALLSLFDLTAAFDTVDHNILSRRLETSYGLKGPRMAHFLHSKPCSVHSLLLIAHSYCSKHLRRATRLCSQPNPLRSLRGRSPSASARSRSPTSCLRRRHTALRLLFSVKL